MNRPGRLSALLAAAAIAASGALWSGCGDDNADTANEIEQDIRKQIDEGAEGLPEEAQKEIDKAQKDAEKQLEEAREQAEEAQKDVEDALDDYSN